MIFSFDVHGEEAVKDGLARGGGGAGIGGIVADDPDVFGAFDEGIGFGGSCDDLDFSRFVKLLDQAFAEFGGGISLAEGVYVDVLDGGEGFGGLRAGAAGGQS